MALIYFSTTEYKLYKKNIKWNMLLLDDHEKSNKPSSHWAKIFTKFSITKNWKTNSYLDVSVTIAIPIWHQSWITEVWLNTLEDIFNVCSNCLQSFFLSILNSKRSNRTFRSCSHVTKVCHVYDSESILW